MGKETEGTMTETKETTQEAVARRLRGHLAEQRITHRELASVMGWDRGSSYRRFRGITALDVNELLRVTNTLGIDPTWLLTGQIDGEQPRRRPPEI